MAATSSARVTSHRCVAIAPPAFFTPSTVSRSRSASRSTAKIFAPSSAKRTAVARPLPQPGPTEPAPVTIATLFARRPVIAWSFPEAVEAEGIVHQERRAFRLRRRNLGEQVHQHAVVRDRGEVGVGPVAAPEAALAELGDERPREGARVGPGRGLPRDTLRAAHLDAEPRIAHEAEEAAERALVDAERGVDTPHVVDHHRHRGALELGCELLDERTLEVHLQVPAELRQARRERDRVVDRGPLAEVAHEVEAHAAEALPVEALELGVE